MRLAENTGCKNYPNTAVCAHSANSKFHQVSPLGFVAAPTSFNRGQPNFA